MFDSEGERTGVLVILKVVSVPRSSFPKGSLYGHQASRVGLWIGRVKAESAFE